MEVPVVRFKMFSLPLLIAAFTAVYGVAATATPVPGLDRTPTPAPAPAHH
jgi:hypothetical protein